MLDAMALLWLDPRPPYCVPPCPALTGLGPRLLDQAACPGPLGPLREMRKLCVILGHSRLEGA